MTLARGALKAGTLGGPLGDTDYRLPPSVKSISRTLECTNLQVTPAKGHPCGKLSDEVWVEPGYSGVMTVS